MTKLEEKDINKVYLVDEAGVRRIFTGFAENGLVKTADGINWPYSVIKDWQVVEIKAKTYKKVKKFKPLIIQAGYLMEANVLMDSAEEILNNPRFFGYAEIECNIEE